MKKLKNYLISYLYLIICILILTLLITIFNYLDLISFKSLKIIITLIPIISIFIGAFKLGKTTTKKGYLEGIKFSLFFILFIILLSIILKEKISISNILLYISYILSSTFGAMIGINKKLIQEE